MAARAGFEPAKPELGVPGVSSHSSNRLNWWTWVYSKHLSTIYETVRSPFAFMSMLVEEVGIEPTGRLRSDRLAICSNTVMGLFHIWWDWGITISQPADYESVALPLSYSPLFGSRYKNRTCVGGLSVLCSTIELTGYCLEAPPGYDPGCAVLQTAAYIHSAKGPFML